MAINGEFICTEYGTIDPTDCWLWGIKEPVAPSRNMFDSDWFLQADGWTKNNGVYTGNARKLTEKYIDLDFKPNTQYTLTYTMSGIGENVLRGRFCFLYTDESSLCPTSSNYVSYAETKTIVLTSSSGKTVKRIFNTFGTRDVVAISNMQVEEGTVATPYRPYGENTFIPQNQQ